MSEVTVVAGAEVEVAPPQAVAPAKSFIETQFPVSLLSKECYKERKAGAGQTLTALGSYWKGRKPLILVRACILGCLLPSTDDAKRDREIFLKLMLMDAEGLRKRWKQAIPAERVLEILKPAVCGDAIEGKKWKRGLPQARRDELQQRAFNRLGYDEKLTYCLRPEEMPASAWDDIWPSVNKQLGTRASSIETLVEELGIRRFGRRPRVADTFCGGGSIPFEAARLGCDVYASDLNPVAAMLTWGALNVIGSSGNLTDRLADAQKQIADTVRSTIDSLGVEQGNDGWRGKVYLYCLEVKCPTTGWMIPVAPSWVISETHKVVAKLAPDTEAKRFDIEIVTGVSDAELKQAKDGTVRDGNVVHPLFPNIQHPIQTLRGDKQPNTNAWGNCLRLWTKEDFIPQAGDLYQERLYCIQWTRTRFDEKKRREITETKFSSITAEDLHRELAVQNEVARNLQQWQERGLVPDSTIEPGDETTRLYRERGWTHWHHLFHPRQLLTLALYKEQIDAEKDEALQAAMAVFFAKMIDWSSRLCQWDLTRNQASHVFYNQAFNTFFTYGVRGSEYCRNLWLSDLSNKSLDDPSFRLNVHTSGSHTEVTDLYITDPPYGDAVNYHEITEFFIAWFRKTRPTVFDQWIWDSCRPLAVKGTGLPFRTSMHSAYRQLVENMTTNALQTVMFTHSSPAVWADIAVILWSAGLQVACAWCVGTETVGGIKQGNFVQGTVLLVLRKRIGDENAWSNRLSRSIRSAVESQVEMMMKVDDREQPNFGDADYQLGAYAAALEVLTQYKTLDNQDVMTELRRETRKGEKSTIQRLLEDAESFASEFLVPHSLEKDERKAPVDGLSGREIWDECLPEERFFLKGMELEAKNETRVGSYQEIARGFGVDNYRSHMASSNANSARLKTARECKASQLADKKDKDLDLSSYPASVVRHALYGIHLAMEKEDLREATVWFENFMPAYWERRKRLIGILEYLATASSAHRAEEARWARDLAGAVSHHGS